MQIDNLHIATTITQYVHFSKLHLMDKAQTKYKYYLNSIKEISKNKDFVRLYDTITILLIMGASVGGISEIAKNKPLGYSAFGFGGLGVLMLLVTVFLPQILLQ
jgi:hypothetical protein